MLYKLTFFSPKKKKYSIKFGDAKTFSGNVSIFSLQAVHVFTTLNAVKNNKNMTNNMLVKNMPSKKTYTTYC